MIGTLVNTAAVIGGGVIGLLLKKNMPERVTTIYFQAIGLFTLAIGAAMAIEMERILIVVASLAIGSLLGEWGNLEKGVERMSNHLKTRFRIGNRRVGDRVSPFLRGVNDGGGHYPGRHGRKSRPTLHQVADGLLLGTTVSFRFWCGSYLFSGAPLYLPGCPHPSRQIRRHLLYRRHHRGADQHQWHPVNRAGDQHTPD